LTALRAECVPSFLTLARTGMRLGEALALQWDDLDYAGGRSAWSGRSREEAKAQFERLTTESLRGS